MENSTVKKIKNAVLGRKYDLSVAFLSPAKMREVMVYKYKKSARGGSASGRKNKVSNVLSFSLSKTSGELLICKAAAKSFSIEYLFIHGLLHLKGLKHGAIMEGEENRLLKRFGFARNG